MYYLFIYLFLLLGYCLRQIRPSMYLSRLTMRLNMGDTSFSTEVALYRNLIGIAFVLYEWFCVSSASF
jgi:ABC-type polysaccharide transport system permease subunit